jgi:hypothetical protein
VDDQRRLVLDEPLPISGKTRVKVIVLVSDAVSETAASRNPNNRPAEAAQQSDQPLPKGLTPWRAAKLGIKLSPPPPRTPITQPPSPVKQKGLLLGPGSAIPDTFPETRTEVQTKCGAELLVKRGSQSGKIFGLPCDLDDKQGYSIGSAVSNKIAIPDDGVLRYHAKITCEAGHYMLRDLALTSRTTVNGNMLDGPTELTNGDVIGLASGIELAFRQPASGSRRGGP